MMLKQDLHIHTVFSTGDSAIVPEQTVDLIASVRHAETIGISDHFEYICDKDFDSYSSTVRSFGLKLGTEVAGGEYTVDASGYPVDYYIYHCKDAEINYTGFERLLATGKPAVIAHPFYMGTNLDRLPDGCLVEINNRYIWRSDWRRLLAPYREKFRFILSSDAHQPNWLNQNVARYVAGELGVEETRVELP
jgi:histidinol phosphatase-like PHP family hydrolase